MENHLKIPDHINLKLKERNHMHTNNKGRLNIIELSCIDIVVHIHVTILIIDKRSYHLESWGGHENSWRKETWEGLEGGKKKG